jgi:hypothetical protein
MGSRFHIKYQHFLRITQFNDHGDEFNSDELTTSPSEISFAADNLTSILTVHESITSHYDNIGNRVIVMKNDLYLVPSSSRLSSSSKKETFKII